MGKQVQRTLVSQAEKEYLLEKQGHKCAYCNFPFGTVIRRNGKNEILKPRFDHFIPFAYLYNSPIGNYKACCQFCNAAKSDYHFENIREVRLWITHRKAMTPFTVVYIPDNPSTYDPEAWAREFAHLLSIDSHKRLDERFKCDKCDKGFYYENQMLIHGIKEHLWDA